MPTTNGHRPGAQCFFCDVKIELGGVSGGYIMPKSNKINASRAATGQINAVLEASETLPEGSKMPPNGSENASRTGLRVEYRPIEALIPFARNPRTHSDEQVAQIAASIKEFGFTNPILLDGENGMIAGHGRLAAAKAARTQDGPLHRTRPPVRSPEARLHHRGQQARPERRLERGTPAPGTDRPEGTGREP